MAENEMAELAIINEFLPAQMSEAEITKFLQSYIANNEIDPAKKGMALGGIMKELKGKADGALVKQIFDSLL